MSFLFKLTILGNFLINFSFVLLANSNSLIFKHIECEIKFDNKELLIKQIEKDKEVCIKLVDAFKEKYEI